jgi:hypothetical protein
LKKQIILLILFTIAVNINRTYSQIEKSTENTKVYNYKGQILDNENKPLVFVHIINIHRGHATTSDSTGFFRIPVVYKDTLRISAIGFYTKFISIEDRNLKDTLVHLIKMDKKTYDIATVNIYELRWQIFKSEFMEEKVEEDKTAIRISNWMAHLVPSDELRMIFQGARGPGFSINYKTKAERSKRKVVEMERKYQLIAPKFNDKMVAEITGLKDKEIYKFIQFCNFDENFLMQATEYEIMEKVLEYWKEYQKQGLTNKKSH